MTNEQIKEEARVKGLAREALARLGRENCTVICPKRPSVSIGGNVAVESIQLWTVRATDDDQNVSCRIEVEADSAESDERITTRLIDLFSSGRWDPATH